MNIKAIEEIFLHNRTCYHFADKQVSDELLKNIYNTMKFGPTSMNCSPLRITFIKSQDAKDKLLECVFEGNKSKVNTAPVTALFTYDEYFYNKMPFLFPHKKNIDEYFKQNNDIAHETAVRNAVLQAAYFIITLKGYGLSCCPMSGFDKEAINKAFFSDKKLKVDFICSIGYRASEEINARLPRFNFDKACEII